MVKLLLFLGSRAMLYAAGIRLIRVLFGLSEPTWQNAGFVLLVGLGGLITEYYVNLGMRNEAGND